MSVARLRGTSGFAIDEVAARAGADPEVLRMENLDTDLAPPPAAIAAVGTDDANSYLPFVGTDELRAAGGRTALPPDGSPVRSGQVVITAGGGPPSSPGRRGRRWPGGSAGWGSGCGAR